MSRQSLGFLVGSLCTLSLALPLTLLGGRYLLRRLEGQEDRAEGLQVQLSNALLDLRTLTALDELTAEVEVEELGDGEEEGDGDGEEWE